MYIYKIFRDTFGVEVWTQGEKRCPQAWQGRCSGQGLRQLCRPPGPSRRLWVRPPRGPLAALVETVWNESPLSHINSDSVNEEQRGMKREGTYF